MVILEPLSVRGMSWIIHVYLNGLNNTFTPVAHGYIALSMNTECNTSYNKIASVAVSRCVADDCKNIKHI